jgi:hypothetical protein
MNTASPKSITRTSRAASGDASTSTLPLLRSAWTMPAPWASARAARICVTISIAIAGAIGPCSATSSSSGSPATYSITRNGTRSVPPKSITRAMLR